VRCSKTLVAVHHEVSVEACQGPANPELRSATSAVFSAWKRTRNQGEGDAVWPPKLYKVAATQQEISHMMVAKLRHARECIRNERGKCEGRKTRIERAVLENNPELVKCAPVRPGRQ
jgi:hypothetical protein